MRKLFTRTMLCAAVAATMLFTGCGSKADNKETTTKAAGANTEEGASDESLQKVMDAGKLILGLDATFKPMGYTDENDEIVGFDIDVAEEVCKRMGVELVKEPINWDTKEQDLNVGKIDCIWNGMSINASRQEIMCLSEAYMENEMVFVVKGDSDLTTMAALEGKNIAVQNGSTAQEILEESEVGKAGTITTIATNVEALQQLELGLVDSVFLDSVVANYEINNSGKDYKILEEGLEKEEYAIGFRKEDQALRDKVQATLSEMKADGKLGEISTKWFGSDITTVK